MFSTLINDAKSAAASVLAKYAMRASVAVPFVVAGGFGTAALTLVLIERFGSVTAYGIMAGGFAAIGLVAAVAVGVKEQEEVVADASAQQSDTAEVATDAAAQAAVQLPLALLGTLLASPLGPGAALSGVKMLGRNLPLVLLLGLVALLFWPTRDKDAAQEAASDQAPPDDLGDRGDRGDLAAPAPDAAQWRQPPNGVDRHAA